MNRRGACGLLLMLLTPPTQAAPPFVVPTEVATDDARVRGGPVEMDLYARDAAGLAAILQVAPPPAGSDHIRYRAQRYPQIAGSPGRDWREATFVVDHDTAEVAALYEDWVASAQAPLTRAGLVEFVADHVRGSMGRGFDVASVVARRQEGDCTEYAVLTAALARRAGWQARVAEGVAVLHGGDGPSGMGHAWAEILEDGQWVVADAALLRSPFAVTYLPYGVLDDEGPGFNLARLSRSPRWIQKIVLHRAEAAAPEASAGPGGP